MSDIYLMPAVIMSKQPLGKTLLRNVIRHTDAHNKVRLRGKGETQAKTNATLLNSKSNKLATEAMEGNILFATIDRKNQQ